MVENLPINPFLELRKERLKRAKAILKASCRGDGKISYPKAVAILTLELGVSEKKCGEYLKILKDFEFIRTEKGEIHVNKIE